VMELLEGQSLRRVGPDRGAASPSRAPAPSSDRWRRRARGPHQLGLGPPGRQARQRRPGLDPGWRAGQGPRFGNREADGVAPRRGQPHVHRRDNRHAAVPVARAGAGKAREELGGRYDLYSLGVVMYQLLTGELPFTAGFDRGAAARPCLRAAAAALGARPELELPRRVSRLVMRCLEKRRRTVPPAPRPSSTSWARAASEPVDTRPTEDPSAESARRSRASRGGVRASGRGA
jgi:serine/threonine protein kinase